MDSSSTGFVMSVISNVALALCSDGVASVLAFSVCPGSTNETTGSLGPLTTGSHLERFARRHSASASPLTDKISSLEEPSRKMRSSHEFARNKLINAFQFEALFAALYTLSLSAASALASVKSARHCASSSFLGFRACSTISVFVTALRKCTALL